MKSCQTVRRNKATSFSLQRRSLNGKDSVGCFAPLIVHDVLGSPGQPLDSATRTFMEPRFGHDFSKIRVHTDEAASKSANAVNALAYTVGRNIVFGQGQFRPETAAGRILLAHELTHSIQQHSFAPTISPHQPITIESPGTSLEQAAERHSSGLSAGTGAIAPVPQPVLQRQPVAEKRRTFAPTVFSDVKALIGKIASDNPKVEDLVGACRYLDALPVATAMAFAQQIAARKPTAIAALESTAMQGWATTRLRVALSAVSLTGQISRVGFAAEHASDIQALDPLAAQQVLDVLGPKIPELESMQKSQGFQALGADEQVRLSYLIGGSTTLSEQAPAQMRALLSNPRTNKDDPATFRKFLTDEKYLKWDVGPPRGLARPRDKFRVGPAVEVSNHPFGDQSSLTADALRYDVEFEAKGENGKDVKQIVPVFLPKSAGIKDKSYGRPTINQVAETLASEPDISLSKIVTVDVHWMTYTGDTGKPDEAHEVIAAAGAEGLLNIYPTRNFKQNPSRLAADVIHETGHTASLAAWGDQETDSRWDAWRAAMRADGMAVSQYGKASVQEDFAESWALYAPVVGTPRENEVRTLIPQRCKLMDTLLWQKPRKRS